MTSNHEGYLVLENVVLPLKIDKPAQFVPPDLEDAMNYYPSFLRYSHLDWMPQRYFETLCKEVSQFVGNGYRNLVMKIMDEYVAYIGLKEFEKWLMKSLTIRIIILRYREMKNAYAQSWRTKKERERLAKEIREIEKKNSFLWI